MILRTIWKGIPYFRRTRQLGSEICDWYRKTLWKIIVEEFPQVQLEWDRLAVKVRDKHMLTW